MAVNLNAPANVAQQPANVADAAPQADIDAGVAPVQRAVDPILNAASTAAISSAVNASKDSSKRYLAEKVPNIAPAINLGLDMAAPVVTAVAQAAMGLVPNNNRIN